MEQRKEQAPETRNLSRVRYIGAEGHLGLCTWREYQLLARLDGHAILTDSMGGYWIRQEEISEISEQ